MRGRLLITILIIFLLAVYYLFGMDYMKQGKEQEVLTSQITEVTQTLEQIPRPPQDLEQRLAVARASLAAEQRAFPSKINTTQVINTIIELADDCEVKAIPLVTQPWSTEKVGEHGYYVFRLNVAVEGSFSRLVSFVSKLERAGYKTLIIENMSVTRVTEQPEEGTVPEGTIPITASVNLVIYTQSLSSD